MMALNRPVWVEFSVDTRFKGAGTSWALI